MLNKIKNIFRDRTQKQPEPLPPTDPAQEEFERFRADVEETAKLFPALTNNQFLATVLQFEKKNPAAMHRTEWYNALQMEVRRRMLTELHKEYSPTAVSIGAAMFKNFMP